MMMMFSFDNDDVSFDYDFLSYIFSVSENTKIIHLIMMIWLFSFIISSYKIVSSPPQDPGGSKKILSKSGYDSQNFLRKNKLSDPFLNEWLKYFQSMCFIFHMTICIFMPKNRDEGDMMGWDTVQGSTRAQFCIKDCRE